MSIDDPFVTVFETGDPGLVAVAKSILDGAGINHVTKGEGVQNLFGLGSVFAGFDLMTGPVQILVDSEDSGVAAALLRDLEEGEDRADGVKGENE